MPLTRDQVRHVAMLARLGLEPGDEEFYAEQLSGILGAIDRLQEVDTDDIPPTAQVVEIVNQLREDEPRPCLTQEEVLANAPAAENGFFVVPSIQEESGWTRPSCPSRSSSTCCSDVRYRRRTCCPNTSS